jgi:cytochrome c peroxidase
VASGDSDRGAAPKPPTHRPAVTYYRSVAQLVDVGPYLDMGQSGGNLIRISFRFDDDVRLARALHAETYTMLRLSALKLVLTPMVAFMFIDGGIARAAALVGKTHSVQIESTLVLALDELKEVYRRPDTIPFPPSNPYTAEKALLGRILYNDTRLSAAGALACVSCHNPGFDYGNGLPKAIGQGMVPTDRRSPSIINTAWDVLFMWDGRASSLEEQALGPIVSPTEIDQLLDRLISTLATIPGYKPLFAAAFPNQAVTPRTVTKAIATYERTIVSTVAPFDSWIEGNEKAIPDTAKRGFELFNAKAGCASCHTGWPFTDDGFHDTDLPDNDDGRGRLLPHVVKMTHAFKTPGLREIPRRGPYMHDGSLTTLEAVVTHYNHGGIDRPSRSELIGPLGLPSREQANIVAFLQSLTSSLRPSFVPELPH